MSASEQTKYNLFVRWNEFSGAQTYGCHLGLEAILPIANDVLSRGAIKIVIEAAKPEDGNDR